MWPLHLPKKRINDAAAILAGMEFQPHWKIRWIAIIVLTLPTLALIIYSLLYPAVHAKGQEGVLAYRIVTPAASAPSGLSWVMQESGTTASLRGIYSVDGKVAWASGTEGTVLRTVDGGAHWTKCAVPDATTDGTTLDFRGVQAWDATTAIVMASGPGDKSRLFKTTDGCKNWSQVFKNAEKEGFWDAIQITGPKTGIMIGDPLPRTELSHLRAKKYFHFPLYGTVDRGDTWVRLDRNDLFALSDTKGRLAQSIFAASNSSLIETANHRLILFVVGGTNVSMKTLEFVENTNSAICKSTCTVTGGAALPLRSGPTAGGFSLAIKNGDSPNPTLVAVGGDYSEPEQSSGTAATCKRDANELLATRFRCEASVTPPHGYRSSVVWSEEFKAWISAGTNGSDVSRDDGKSWIPLDDGNWNALSLPFVVGPKGRVARLSVAAAK